jgi:galactokinase
VNPADVLARFRFVFGSAAAPVVWRAPGRVNLIGEHTDYNLGLVLPMAIDLACYVAAAPSTDGILRAYSEQFAELTEWDLEDIPSLKSRGHWSDRVAGVAWELLRNGVSVTAQNLVIDSEVPLGAGLSSSAALGVAVTLALGGTAERGERIAQLARAAEVEFVGVPCGIMDQFVSANGQAGAAILLDCRSLEWHAVALPEQCRIVTADSMVKHELANSGYNTRVAECRQAARTLGVPSLRDAQLSQIDGLPEPLRKRARHVITENQRVEQFAAASLANDLEQMGRLMIASHRSLRDDYQVSSAELDFLVDCAIKVPGVLGARMMGGGFGGSTVNLVRPDAVKNLREQLLLEYSQFSGLAPEVRVCFPSAGASRVL